MRIYTKAGDLSFKSFDFPDGQPHFKLETIDDSGFTSVTVELTISSPADLFMLVLVSSVLRSNGYSEINLDIRYLMGGRMDRAISNREPFTLDVVARIINGCGFSRVRILDVHSEVATKLIRNSVNVLPFKVVEQVKETLGHPWIVCPDKGAFNRVSDLGGSHVRCSKVRNMSDGNLLDFKIEDGVEIIPSYGASCLIIDDICDGGGTFVGLAKELRKAGAKKVFLYITHGIFSKGWPLEGIDKIYTTDSIFPNANVEESSLVVIPISMKELV